MANKRQQKKQAAMPIEITRSFSFKLNCGSRGGAQYESMDFFMSGKTLCTVGEEEKASAAVYDFCKREVIKSVGVSIQDLKSGAWEKLIDTHQTAKTNAAAFEKRQAERELPPRNHARVAQLEAARPSMTNEGQN